MLSGYRLMWMMVAFDLPVVTEEDRCRATRFRNVLLDLGFGRAQLSVYLRFCSGPEATETLVRQIREQLPPEGKVDILFFTDKQYERSISFRGRRQESVAAKPEQYVLF